MARPRRIHLRRPPTRHRSVSRAHAWHADRGQRHGRSRDRRAVGATCRHRHNADRHPRRRRPHGTRRTRRQLRLSGRAASRRRARYLRRKRRSNFCAMTDVVALAAELLSIQSPTGHERRVVDFVSRWLVGRGWNVTIQEVTPGRSNVWASRAGGGVTLSTHLDTVPPYVAPRLVGDRLLGRGACDAKGIAAAMMVAADRLATG